MSKTATERLQVRIDEQMKKKIQEKAASMGLDVSNYIRFLIIQDLKKGSN
jgi:antitoxin component of RelBE/YafQ-DinJ toxin-antitoxin module